METVNFLAALWGFSLMIISLSFLINPKNIKSIFELMRSDSVIILSGGINVILGIASILAYNIWSLTWGIIITILGWAMLLKGVLRLFFPGFVLHVLESYKNKTEWFPLLFLFLLFIGCFLVYMGFTY